MTVLVVFQSALQKAVNDAGLLLLHDPTRFGIPLSSRADIAQPRSVLSTQFSTIAPKIINYDPQKPVKVRVMDSPVLAQRSHLLISGMSDIRRHSSSNMPTALEAFDVISLIHRQTVPFAELSMGWVNPQVGLGRRVGMGRDCFIFGGFGRGSETAEVQNLKFFTFTEFVDTDGHGFGWVVGWVGLWVQIFTMVWFGLGWIGL